MDLDHQISFIFVFTDVENQQKIVLLLFQLLICLLPQQSHSIYSIISVK